MRKLIYTLFLGSFTGINAQTGSNPNPVNTSIDMYPKSPEAAALSKFVDIPAGNYTGVADFTIPLYTIEFDGQKIPIELRYTTAGVTVGQIATRVGLGWMLNTGPSLSQQVIGMQDRTFPRRIVSPNFNPQNNNIDYELAQDATGVSNNGVPFDIKPDIFTYNLLDKSGRYILNATGNKGISLPYDQVKIIPNSLYQMKITDEEGFAYDFSSSFLGTQTKNTCRPPNSEFDYDDPNFKISKISSSKNSEVKYLYDPYPNSVYDVTSRYINSIMTQVRVSMSGNPVPGQPVMPLNNKCINYTQSKDNPLTEIQFEGGKVIFTYNNKAIHPREDLAGDVYLTKVVVKNDRNDIIKDFTLNYGYFLSPELIPAASGIFTNLGDYIQGINKRLKLVSIKDNLINGTYSFEYYESYQGKTLPYRISNNQDYWGIYNGASNGEKAISLSKYENINIPSDYIGADKNPNAYFGKLGNLRKITYPTGGYTEIEYEADDFDISENPEVIYSYQNEDLYYDAYDDTHPPTKQPFIIPATATSKKLLFNGRAVPTSTHQVGRCTWYLKKSGGNEIFGQNSGFFDRDDTAGSYELWVTRDINYPNQRCSATYSFKDITKTPIDTITTKKAGTLRVSKIQSVDNNNNKIVRQYTYTQPASNHILPYIKSSGVNQGEEIFMSLSTHKYPLSPQNHYAIELIASNNPGWQTATVRGKSVGYTYVQEHYIDEATSANSYRKDYHFKNEPEPQFYDPGTPVNVTWIPGSLDRGLLLEEVLFDSSYNMVKKVKNEYAQDAYFNKEYGDPLAEYGSMGLGLEIVPTVNFGGNYTFEYTTFPLKNYWVKHTSSRITEYSYPSDSLQTLNTYNYSVPSYTHTYPTATISEGSMGEVVSSVHKYPQDHLQGDSEYSTMQNLISKNLISEPVITKTLTDSRVTSEVKTVYGQFGSGTESMILPTSIYLKKGENAVEENRKITYNSYDTKGNITQYTMENGIPVSVIWGYNKTLPVVKIEGAAFATVSGNSLVTSVITAAENDNSGVAGQTTEETEQSLITALDNLRKDIAFKDFHITTYSYSPLVGVKTVTPPSGIREYYFYDTAQRLQSVKIKEKDSSGNDVYRIIKEYRYNYQQP